LKIQLPIIDSYVEFVVLISRSGGDRRFGVEGQSSIKSGPTGHAKLYHVLKVMTDHRRCKVSLALPSFNLALPFIVLFSLFSHSLTFW